MFGNKLGWGLAGVEVCVMAVIVYMAVLRPNKPSLPTRFGTELVNKTMELPAEITSLATQMTEDRDAGSIYRELIPIVTRDIAKMESIFDPRKVANKERKDWPDPPSWEAVDLLKQAARCRRATIFGSNPQSVVGYLRENQRRDLNALKTLAYYAEAFGDIHQAKGRTDEAKAMYEAMLSMGIHLAEERLCFAQFHAGLGAISKSLRGLASLDKEAAAKAQLAYRDYNTSLTPMKEGMFALYPHPGDMALLATGAKDRMWRAEAILGLGRCKYGTERKPDRFNATRIVRQLAADKTLDPALRTAAEAAAGLTVEDYRMLGS